MEDCYFFLYSECKLKDRCMYRHNLMSKDNLITCKTWKKTKKCRVDCPFRHSTYHEVKQRKEIMCYWEDKGGCTKYRCEYKHNDPSKDDWKEVRVKSLNEIIISKSTIEREVASSKTEEGKETEGKETEGNMKEGNMKEGKETPLKDLPYSKDPAPSRDVPPSKDSLPTSPSLHRDVPHSNGPLPAAPLAPSRDVPPSKDPLPTSPSLHRDIPHSNGPLPAPCRDNLENSTMFIERTNSEAVKRLKKEIIYEDVEEEIRELDKELEELDDILNED